MPVTGHTIGKKLNRSNVYFVESLEEAVEIAKKNYKKENELGVLAGSFNYMIEDLSRLYESLEEELNEKPKIWINETRQ